jgi:hypothetical protein
VSAASDQADQADRGGHPGFAPGEGLAGGPCSLSLSFGIKTMESEIAEVVREHGWFAADINDGDPPFLYTIGLMQTWDHPELILFGRQSYTAHRLLSIMVDAIRNGASYREPGTYAGVLQNDARIGVRHVDPTQHQLYLGYAMGYLSYIGRIGELRAMQVFWPDRTGKVPYEVGCDLEVHRLQPRLDLALSPSEIEEFEREWGG